MTNAEEFFSDGEDTSGFDDFATTPTRRPSLKSITPTPLDNDGDNVRVREALS